MTVQTYLVQKKRDVPLEIVCVDKNGTAISLVGATVRVQVREKANASTVLKTYTTADSSIVITDAAGGKAKIDVDKADYAAIVIREGKTHVSYVFDVLVITAAGEQLQSHSGDDFIHEWRLHANVTEAS